MADDYTHMLKIRMLCKNDSISDNVTYMVFRQHKMIEFQTMLYT